MGKVRFAERQNPATPPPTVSAKEDHAVTVNLGLTQCGGIYITPVMKIDRSMQDPIVCNIRVSNISTELRNNTGQQACLMLRFLADKPGPFNTCFTVCFTNQHEQVTVHISALVMPRDKGTPGLRPLVHCVGFASDTDTEGASEWHGFE